MTARVRGEPPFTYADYRTWPDNERWELIDGQAYLMTQHQIVSGNLLIQLAPYFRSHGGLAFAAPFDVRLPRADEPDDAIDTVVQPDLSVVCDKSQLDERGCRGAPELVVEILSPSTTTHDSVTKRGLYERQGVREYWLVHPLEQTLTIYRRGEDGAFLPTNPIPATGKLSSSSFAGLVIDCDAMFADVTASP